MRSLTDICDQVTTSQSYILPDSQPLNFKQFLLEVIFCCTIPLSEVDSSLEQAKYDAGILKRVKNDKFVKFRLLPVVIADEEVHNEAKWLPGELAQVRVQNVNTNFAEKEKNSCSVRGKNSKPDARKKGGQQQQLPSDEVQFLKHLMPTANCPYQKIPGKPKSTFIKLEKGTNNSFQPNIKDGNCVPLVNMNNSFSKNIQI